MNIKQLPDGRWYASYYVGPKQRRISHTNKKQLIAEAEAERNAYRLNKSQPELVKKQTTFADAADKYLEQYAFPNGQDADKYQIPYFVKFFESIEPGIKISDITVDQLKDLKAQMLKDYQPSTMIRRWTLLNSIFRESLANGYVSKNPCKEISNKAQRKAGSRRNTARHRWFTDEETQQIYAELLRVRDDDRYTSEQREEHMLYAQVARNTGLRPDSIDRLEWFDINFEASRFTARDTKNGQTYIMPMNKGAKAALTRIWEMKGKPQNGFVFRRTDWSRIFTKLFRRLGWNDSHLPDTERRIAEQDQAVLYSFRHTFASHLVMKGKSGKALWDLMGWENGTEEATYAHLSPKFLADAVDEVSSEYKPESLKLEVI